MMTRLLALLREPLPEWDDLAGPDAGHALAVLVAWIVVSEAALLAMFGALWRFGWRDV